MRLSSAFLLAALGVSLVACAQGSQLDTGAGGYGGAVTGAGASTSSTDSRTSSSGDVGGGSPSGSSSSSGSPSGSSSSSGSPSGSSSSGSSSSSGGPTCVFDAPAACASADVLQAIAGDQHNDTRTATGNTSHWYSVDVQEQVSSFTSYPQLSYTVTLASPPGTSYGLFVYEGDGSGPTCFAAAMPGTGNPATVTDAWSDTPIADDSRWITIEVRYLSGEACGPSDLWTLAVEGHTQP